MSLFKRETSIEVNYNQTISFAGGHAGIAITSHGDWYWAVTAIMMASSFAFMGLGFTKARHQRAFHYITALITMVATIAYFTMASNIGWAPTPVEFHRSDPHVAGKNRQVFYVRYIDWVITTPLLLMDLLLTAGLPWPIILFTVMVDEIMIICGLVGALVHSSYKWGYFFFGMIALFYIGFVLIFEARTNAYRIGRDVGKSYLICGSWTFFLWMLYPIAWSVAEGGNLIAPDSEAVFYGILDILAKPVFGALLLWGHKNIDPKRLGMHIGSGNCFEDESEEKQKEVKEKDVEATSAVERKTIDRKKVGDTSNNRSSNAAVNQQSNSARNMASPVYSGRTTGASTRTAGGGYSTPAEPARYARNDGTSSATYSIGGGSAYQAQRDKARREQVEQDDELPRRQSQQDYTQRVSEGRPIYAIGGQQDSATQVNRGMMTSTEPTYSTNTGGMTSPTGLMYSSNGEAQGNTSSTGQTYASNSEVQRGSTDATGNSGFGLNDTERDSGNYASGYATNIAQDTTTSSSSQGGRTTYYTRDGGGVNAATFVSSSGQGGAIPEEDISRYTVQKEQESNGDRLNTSGYMSSSRQAVAIPEERTTGYSSQEERELSGGALNTSSYMSSNYQGTTIPEEGTTSYTYTTEQGGTGETGDSMTRTYYITHPSSQIVRSGRNSGGGGATETFQTQTQTSSATATGESSSASGGYGLNDGVASSSTAATTYKTAGGGGGGEDWARISRNVGSVNSGRSARVVSGEDMSSMGFSPGSTQSIRHETNPDGTVTYYTTYAYTSAPGTPSRG